MASCRLSSKHSRSRSVLRTRLLKVALRIISKSWKRTNQWKDKLDQMLLLKNEQYLSPNIQDSKRKETMFPRLKISLTGSMLFLMSALMFREDGCIWRASSVALLTSRHCFLWRQAGSCPSDLSFWL